MSDDWAEKSYPCLSLTCGNYVGVEGHVCWPCQSYEEQLAGPHCECPHVRGCECLCDPEDCTDCPELDYLLYLAQAEQDARSALEEAVKAPEGEAQPPQP